MNLEFLDIEKSVIEDLKFDDISIKDITMNLPSKKHYWAGRLIRYKIELKKLKDKKIKAQKDICEKCENTKLDVPLTKASALKVLNNSPQVIQVNERIEDLEMIIEYLEKVDSIFYQMSFDLKNAIELIKLEQL